jgi:hypothetical protein
MIIHYHDRLTRPMLLPLSCVAMRCPDDVVIIVAHPIACRAWQQVNLSCLPALH